ncbi:MAG: hypothetical protein QOJ99_4526 [Bryobacterales bacterium]|nr:hypothetical protein [Bryobacterales bacterium]
MKHIHALFCFLPLSTLSTGALAQESRSGLDLRATISGEAVYSRELPDASRNGAHVTGGIRAVFYPEWKISSHWAVSGAIQVNSLSSFDEDSSTHASGIRSRFLQAQLGYYRVWKGGSLVIRAGQMQSAFGNFLLHYDDAKNPLLGTPAQYNYDGAGVTTLGLAGIEAMATRGKWDARAQFTNSSPANPRSVFDRDQYANWTGGLGYSVWQGLRAGISTYRGPYLDRNHLSSFLREARSRDLPATAWGADVEWARGHWSVTGEWQRFILPQPVLPWIQQTAAYADAQFVLHPRWYIAARAGFRHANQTQNPGEETYEVTVGFRPYASQLIKAGYVLERSRTGDLHHTLALQFITTIHPFFLCFGKHPVNLSITHKSSAL